MFGISLELLYKEREVYTSALHGAQSSHTCPITQTQFSVQQQCVFQWKNTPIKLPKTCSFPTDFSYATLLLHYFLPFPDKRQPVLCFSRLSVTSNYTSYIILLELQFPTPFPFFGLILAPYIPPRPCLIGKAASHIPSTSVSCKHHSFCEALLCYSPP